MPDLYVLEPDQYPADRRNHVLLTEVVRPSGGVEYTFTVLIDGNPLSVGGPFEALDVAVAQAKAEADHYALEPIYLRREHS
jgi:hypothetical protein